MARKNVMEFRIIAKNEAGRELRNVSNSVDRINSSLKQLAVTLASALSLRQVNAWAESWRLAENRIRLVTKNLDELRAVQDELVEVALRSRTSLSATIDLYARVARSSKTLGVSQAELLEFTETVSKSLIISGATAAEASAGVIQFGQALASSRLSGDELRSVMEQLVRLAAAIADGLKVDIGQLRELGEQGALTAFKVFTAVQTQGRKISGEFGGISTLLSQSFTKMETAMLATIGVMDRMAGATDFLVAALDPVPRMIINFGKAITGTLKPADKLSTSIEAIAIGLLTVMVLLRIMGKLFVETFSFIATTIGDAASTFGEQVAAAFVMDFDSAQKAGDAFVKRLNENLFDSFVELGPEIQLMLTDAMESIAKVLNINRIIPIVVDLTTGGIGEEPITRKQREEMAKAEKGLEQIIAALELSNSAFFLAERTALDYADSLAIVKVNALALVSGNADMQLSALTLLDLNRKLTAASEARIQAEKDAADALADSLKFMESLADQAARNIQDAFAEFLFDPFEDGVRGMLKGFIDALRTMLSQALAFKILSSIPGAAGEFFTARAAGGPVNAGQPVLVGERGPEIFIPGASGTVMNNSASKASGGGMTFVVNIDARGADPGLIARLPAIMEQRDRQLMIKVKQFVETGSVLI